MFENPMPLADDKTFLQKLLEVFVIRANKETWQSHLGTARICVLSKSAKTKGFIPLTDVEVPFIPSLLGEEENANSDTVQHERMVSFVWVSLPGHTR